jgi:hypothetical protein
MLQLLKLSVSKLNNGVLAKVKIKESDNLCIYACVLTFSMHLALPVSVFIYKRYNEPMSFPII